MQEQMNENLVATEVTVGGIYTGTVTKVEDKQALVDIGAKQEAILPIRELSSFHVESMNGLVNVGDEIKVKVTELTDEDMIVSKREVDSEVKWDEMDKLLNSGEILEGTVREVVKGGLVVDVGLRGFIPASMVSNQFVEDLSTYTDQVLQLKVVEVDREKNRIILSHRAVLELEAKKSRDKAMSTIKVGSVLEGTVSRIAGFGAFVDLKGVEGLVHISQISHKRVHNVEEALQVGQTVKVKVLDVDVNTGRISLSMKETEAHPWDEEVKKFAVGQIVEGTVKRLLTFGAFVQISDNVEGLLHVSHISDKHLNHPKEALSENQKVTVKILEINLENRKLALGMKEIEEDRNNEELKQFQAKQQEENTNFNLSELIGDKLKQFTNK